MSRTLLENIELAPKGHLIIIGGTHGAGKSTFCRELREALAWPYLSPQEINQEQAGLSQNQVFRLIIDRVKEYLKEGRSFLFEHVMSGHFIDKLMGWAAKQDFLVHLVYINISSPEKAQQRIVKRVSAGGHPIESQEVEYRLSESRKHFWENYRHRADTWSLYDNSAESRQLVAFSAEDELIVDIQEKFAHFKSSI